MKMTVCLGKITYRRPPKKILCKKNKKLPISQSLKQAKKLKGSIFYYGKAIKRINEGICKQSEVYKYDRYYEQHEGVIQ